jgi:hypothetical protein
MASVVRQHDWKGTREVEEISEDALISLRTALDDVFSQGRSGNSTDRDEAVRWLINKAEALLEEVGY